MPRTLHDKHAAARLGANVRRFRNNAGFNIKQLAKRASLSSNYLSYIEKGRRDPSLTTLLKIATALDVAPGEFLDTPSKELTPAGRECARLFAEAPPEIQAGVLQLLRSVMDETTSETSGAASSPPKPRPSRPR